MKVFPFPRAAAEFNLEFVPTPLGVANIANSIPEDSGVRHSDALLPGARPGREET